MRHLHSIRENKIVTCLFLSTNALKNYFIYLNNQLKNICHEPPTFDIDVEGKLNTVKLDNNEQLGTDQICSL